MRVAIDAAIWNFQNQSAQGGKNPALRTLFFRLLKLLALPLQPIFVYDGKNKPLTKRGKTVTRYGTCIPNELSKNLVARFQFPHHTAPGEAEAECAFLQKNGIVDAVMSQDVDAIMFGSTLTLRDWSKEGTKGNKTPTHVNVLDLVKIKETSGLDPAGMILVALLSGGDYHDGVPGFGPALACSIARAGFGDEMIDLVLNDDAEGMREWRERLQYELRTNESGYFSKRHKTIDLPADFPDQTVLRYYLEPAVSKKEDLRKLEARWVQWWAKDIDVQELRQYTGITFDWMYKGGAKRFIRCFAQPLLQHRLKTRKVDGRDFSRENITERRQHFVSDGIPELRLSAIPGNVVGIDLDAEEENPEYADLDADDGAEDIEVVESTAKEVGESEGMQLSSPSKRRKRPPWDPSNVEKWWIPEALLKLGLPAVVEDWYEEQRAIRADPVKFATRKCKQPAKTSNKIDKSMKHGALKQYLPTTKSDSRGSTIDHEQETQYVISKGSSVLATDSATITPSSQDSRLEIFFQPTNSMESVPETDLVEERKLASRKKDSDRQFATKTHRRSVEDHPTGQLSENSLATTPPNDNALTTNVSPFVTQRKKRQTRRTQNQEKPPQEEDDDEVVFVGESKAPPPIASFFRSTTGRSKQSCTVEQEVSHMVATPDLSERRLLNKKLAAIPRDSLPGAWKELLVTPSQSSRVSFIDLTNS